MDEYRLNYFSITGRGECIRLVLHLAGVNFLDNQIQFSMWGEAKKNSKYLINSFSSKYITLLLCYVGESEVGRKSSLQYMEMSQVNKHLFYI